MRKIFAEVLFKKMSQNENIILLTGDLGYGLWDKIKINYPDRFYNFGSAEVLMMGAAVGMALERKIPFVYSITPFLIYRPYELIRNYLDHEKIPVKLIGGGRDRDYGNLGFSHWAEEDKECPVCSEEYKEPVLTYCCKSIMCSNCIKNLYNTTQKCPFCRVKLDMKNMVISSSKVPIKNDIIKDEKLTKLEAVKKIISSFTSG